MSKDNYLDVIWLEAFKLEVKSSKYWVNEMRICYIKFIKVIL